MKKVIRAKAAANALLIALSALAVFHILMVLGVLPASMVWGGRADGARVNLGLLEVVSLVVTGLIALVVAAKIGYLKAERFRRVIAVSMWVVFAYFVLNTLGNLASSSSLEKAIFTPVSLVLSILALRLAIEK